MTSLRDTPRGTVMQVCHVTRTLEARIAEWVSVHGAGPFFCATFVIDGHTYRGEPHRVNLQVAIGCLGSTVIELAQPADDAPSPFREVLDRRGEGLHHYWIQADDFDAELARYAGAGCPLVSGGEITGIGRSAFVDTTPLLGCFTELIELNDTGWTVLEEIRAAHLTWNGRNPVRPYPSI